LHCQVLFVIIRLTQKPNDLFLGGFMRKQHLLGLMSIVMLTTACGKSMTLTTKAAVHGPASNKDLKHIVKDPAVLDGKLLPFSSYDMSILKSELLFVDSDDANNNSRSAIGSPEFVISGESAKQGFVKQSNVVFRAIRMVPPVAAYMQKVTNFKLVLKDVRFYNDGTVKAEDALKNQVICLVDADPTKLKCAGGKLDLTDKNINPFWKSATLSQYELATMADFKSIYDMKGDEKIYQYVGVPAPVTATTAATLGLPTSSPSALDLSMASASTDDATVANRGKLKPKPVLGTPKATPVIVAASLEIDLQKAFGIADKDIAQWIIDNSTVYDASGNYRKFRFQLGNNIYAKEGSLEFSYNPDTTVKLPSELAAVADAAVNGDSDVSKDTDYQTGIKVDDSTVSGVRLAETIPDTEFSFDLGTDGKTETISDASMTKLKTLATLLIKNQASILEIHVRSQMELTNAGNADQTIADPGKTAAEARAALIKTALTSLGVTANIEAKGFGIPNTCAAAGECQNDRATGLGIILGKELAAAQATSTKTDLDTQIKSIFSLAAPATPVVASAE
jgi:hypothetical protein